MQIAASMMDNAANAGIKPLSLDGGKINRAAPQVHRWSVTGTVGAATLNDQAAFYNLLSDSLEGTNVAATPTFSSSSRYSAASATRYIADNAAPLKMMHFTGAVGTGAATLLESTVVKFVRETPDGSSQSEQIELATFVSPNRYQTGVLSVPINGEVLDGYTYPRVISPEGTPTANGYKLSFAFGATNDKRADVPAARAATVVSP